MKIFFDYNIFYKQKYGGISSYYFNLFKEFNNDDISFLACPILNKNRYIRQINKNIFSLNIFECPSAAYGLIDKVNFHVSKIFLKFYNPDIIHITNYNKKILNHKRAKKVLTVYDMITEIFPNKNNFELTCIKKKTIEEADHIICISEKTKLDLIDYFNIASTKISVIHLGANLIGKNYVLEKKNFILYVGSRKGYKNFENFLCAVRTSKFLYKDFYIICFGGEKFSKYDHDLLAKYKFDFSKIKYLNGDDIFLQSLYSSAKLFVFPSLYEGFGLPVLESMANNCPVVCSNAGSLPEVAGDSALYFDPNSSESIRNTIEHVIYNDELIIDLVEKGIQRIKLFSWKKCANETINLYKKII